MRRPRHSQKREKSALHERYSRWVVPGICICLIAITWMVFGQTLRHDFVNYDDDRYVYENSRILNGLTVSGVAWAFTHPHARNWHPLTTISHMLDSQLYGLKAGGHHFTNVLLHTVAALLLFLVLREMTGGPSRTGNIWRSAFVAAIFAIHPLRVESVAWVAERKDVLSAIFFMLTLGAYLRYVRRPSFVRYVILSILFACGLMSKPMLVTLPFLLLVLDYWPLGRIGHSRSWPKLLLEKIPLLLLSAASSILTFLIQKRGGFQALDLPLMLRIDNALTACVVYIRQLFWPAGLAPFYPRLEEWSGWKVALAFTFLLIITMAVVLRRRRNPYLFTGWFWYVGMLVPVLGIVQVGLQGWADRYTYLPHIGISIGVTWLVADLAAAWPRHRPALAAAAALVLGTFVWGASLQASHWRNSEALWATTLATTSGNAVAHNNLGDVLFKQGRTEEALSHYQKALEIHARNRQSGYNLPLAVTHTNLGSALRRKGLLDQAIDQYDQAIRSQPDYFDGYWNLAGALSEKGELDDAILAFRKALELRPEDAETHVNLGYVMLQKGMNEQAIVHFEKALQLEPDSLKALNNLAWLYATSGNPSIWNGPRAVTLAERAVKISAGNDPFFLHKLAAAYAANGNFPKALEVAEKGLQLATSQGNSTLIHELQRNIALYRSNTSLRDASRSNVPPSP